MMGDDRQGDRIDKHIQLRHGRLELPVERVGDRCERLYRGMFWKSTET
jgi:hypothetical protein